MAFTLEQYETLQSAIASGTNTVSYGDKKVTYNSLNEMLKVLAIMKNELFPTQRPIKNKLTIADKGIYG